MKKNNNIFIIFYSYIQKKSLTKIKELMYYIDRVLCIFIKNKNTNKTNNKKNIAILFNLAFGDSVIFFQSLNDIRKIYPKEKYNIDLYCQKGLEKIYVSANKFDNIYDLDFNSATINIKKRIEIIKKIKSNKYDILLDPVTSNECTTNVLMSKNFNATEKIGCIMNTRSMLCPKIILNKTYTKIKYVNSDSYLEIFYEFFYNDYEIILRKINGEKCKIKLPKKYYIVFVNASNELKKWPLERYSEIVKRIYEKTKYELVLCGTKSDIDYTNKFIKLIDEIPYINIVGQTNLMEFIDVINNSKFVISNDTSVYHIALLNQIPVTIITGGYTYDKYVLYHYKGYKKYNSPYIVCKPMKCFNCYNKCKKINKNDIIWPCLNNNDTEYAWKIIEKMINKVIGEK